MLTRREFVTSTAAMASAACMPALAAEADVVSVGINAWIGYGPWYIAKHKGFDAAHSVKISFVNLSSNDDITSTLAAGSVDSTHLLITSAIRDQAAGIPFRIALFQDISTTADAIIAKPDIANALALKGRTVGVPKDSGGEYLLQLVLQKAGLSLSDVKLLDMQADQAAVAFIAGRVDAAVTYEPYISNAKKEVSGTVTIANAGEVPGVISDIWAVTEKLAMDRPQAVIGMLRAWNDSVKYLRSNPADAFVIMADGMKTPLAELQSSFSGVKLYDLPEAHDYMQNELPTLGKRIEDIMRSKGGLKGPTDFSKLIDISFAAKALGA